MSGFVKRYPGRYELTASAADRWHRNHDGCACPDLQAMARAHLTAAGFTVEHDGGTWLRLAGPGLDAASTDELFAALRGPK